MMVQSPSDNSEADILSKNTPMIFLFNCSFNLLSGSPTLSVCSRSPLPFQQYYPLCMLS